MKRLLIIASAICLLSACVKNDTVQTAFSFNTGGVTNFAGNTYTAVYHKDTLGIWHFNAKLYNGDSTVKNYVQITFSSPGVASTGTYMFDTIPSNALDNELYYVYDSLTFNESSGTLQITQMDTVNRKISGTFVFSARNAANTADSIQISNGKFNSLVYVVQ